MSNRNKYISIIEQINVLYSKELAEKQKSQQEQASQYLQFCETTKYLYNIEKERVYCKNIKPFVDDNMFLCNTSVLRIIKKDEIEDCHTKILAYIFDRNTKCGAKILSSIIATTYNSSILCSLIEKGVYQIENEYPIRSKKHKFNNKRIDLLITDDINKWYLVIENKVNSEVHNASNTDVSQLDVYSQFCKSKFKDYKGYFILLSYKDNQKHITNSDWVYMNYLTIFKILLPYYRECDIVKDYLRTLFYLLFRWQDFDTYQSCGGLSQSVQFYNEVIRKTK